MKYMLRLDWGTLNFDKGAMSKEHAGKLLAGDLDLKWKQKGANENAPFKSPLGLCWVDNSGWDAAPHKLEISGVGCEHFAPTLAAVRDRDLSHFSRVDFAFDAVMSRADWRDFITKVFAASMVSDRQAKKFRLSGEGEAMTVYIGSRKCAKFFRIYNKTLQSDRYEFLDSENGKVVPISEDQCVIRYEVELKRHKVVRSTGEVRVFDPSPCFDAYYSHDPDQVAWLMGEIHKLWTSFGNEILLPAGFEDADFVRRLDFIEQNKNTVKYDSLPDDSCLKIVRDKLHDFPHTFDSSLDYVARRFGKYIPYLLADSVYREVCFSSCRDAFGFIPDFEIVDRPAGFYDMDDESDDDLPFAPFCVAYSGEQLTMDDIDYLYGKEVT